jgi:hypothetical protein
MTGATGAPGGILAPDVSGPSVLMVEDDPGVATQLHARVRAGPGKVRDVHVAALRRKLGLPGLIETGHGHGFRLGETT